jgi:hypothetical protein
MALLSLHSPRDTVITMETSVSISGSPRDYTIGLAVLSLNWINLFVDYLKTLSVAQTT